MSDFNGVLCWSALHWSPVIACLIICFDVGWLPFLHSLSIFQEIKPFLLLFWLLKSWNPFVQGFVNTETVQRATSSNPTMLISRDLALCYAE